jgi:glycosyltransferase involved in cell wall biosynthesis
MRRLSEILSALSRERDVPFSAVSLLDNGWDPARHMRPVSYWRFASAAGSRSKFVRQIVELAARCPGQQLILGHVALTPIAYALRRAGLIGSYYVTLHGTEAWQRLRLAERVGCRLASKMISTTQFTRARFCQANQIAEERVPIIPLAIDKASLAPPSLSDAHAMGPLRVLFVGRLCSLDRYKGADELIEAVAHLQKEKVAVQLDIVGTGDDQARLENKTAALDAGGAVSFPGALSDAELENRYRSCDLFALPSWGEGFGIVFLEAMSYGKPCLGAASGGVPEVIADGHDGFLVPYGEVGRVVECLRTAAKNRGQLRVFGERAYQKVSSQYLLGNMLSNWSQLLEDGERTTRSSALLKEQDNACEYSSMH